MPCKIFINYRRGDDPGFTGRLFDFLENAFSADQLFIDCNPGPLFLGFVLSPLLELNFFRSLQGTGDLWMFFTRPFSGVLLIAAIVLLAHAVLPPFDRSRMES